MTEGLRVTPEKLTETAEIFSTQAREIRASTGAMLEQAEKLALVWKGNASQTYTARLRSLDGDIQKLLQMITEHCRKLQEMAAVYEQAERENQENAGALTGAGIL